MSLELYNLKELDDTSAKKLHDNGISNLMVLASMTAHELETIGIKVERAKGIIEKATKMVNEYLGGKDGFITGDQLLQKFDERMILSTRCPSFDKILDGGFETQKVYEVYGKEGTGKSSLMLQLICLSHLPIKEKGLGSPATVYIDTEGSFSIKRLKKMVMHYDLDPNELVKSVVLSTPPTSDALVYLCEKNLMKIMEETGAKLIILDSLATHFRNEYGDVRQLLPERQRRANRVIHAMKKATRIFNALAVMTNQAVANVNMRSPYDHQYNHAMGLLIGHESQVRLRIAPFRDIMKEIKVEKAVDLPNEECYLNLTGSGFIEPNAQPKKKAKKKGKQEEVESEKEPESEEDSEGEYDESEYEDITQPAVVKNNDHGKRKNAPKTTAINTPKLEAPAETKNVPTPTDVNSPKVETPVEAKDVPTSTKVDSPTLEVLVKAEAKPKKRPSRSKGS